MVVVLVQPVVFFDVAEAAAVVLADAADAVAGIADDIPAVVARYLVAVLWGIYLPIPPSQVRQPA